MQVAAFPVASENVYMTVVTPKVNVSPDWCELVTCGGTPESSVAVGFIQVTVDDGVPGDTICVIGSGQPLITGAMLSTGVETTM